MTKTVRTRFAPSPTGFMHVGNLRTALYAWLLARSQHGRFILRIEDTDRARLVENAVEIIYSTLRRAGLNHDEGPDSGGDFGPYVQSERVDIYRKYAHELVDAGHAYYCFCEKHEEDDEPENASAAACPGNCGAIAPAVASARAAAGEPYVIRQRIPRDGVTVFTDSVFGEISIENKVLDEQILLKRDGFPTYNFANVIDDHLMEISHVVRGSEYLSSTPKYNLLYRAFGWEIPEYVHLPLIMGRDAEGNVSKLSKRHGAVSFENLVAEGYLPEAIVNYIALLGWSPKSDREIFSLDELAEAFSLSGLNKAAAVFDYAKLRWMNSEHIRTMPAEEFVRVARPFAGIDGSALEANWPRLAALLQPRVEVLGDIPEKISFLRELPEFELEMFNNKKSKCTPEIAADILAEVIGQFEAAPTLNGEIVSSIIAACAERRGVKLNQPMWAVRVALSGQPATPGGPGDIVDVLGREESLRRLHLAVRRLGAGN